MAFLDSQSQRMGALIWTHGHTPRQLLYATGAVGTEEAFYALGIFPVLDPPVPVESDFPTVVAYLSTADPLDPEVRVALVNLVAARVTGAEPGITGQAKPGSVHLTLDSSDREYDALNTAGPYYGYLTPQRHVIVEVDHAVLSGPTDLGHGFANDWAVQWFPPAVGVAEVDAPDLLAFLGDTPSPLSVLDIEIAADSPHAWYGLGEDSRATQAADKSGNLNDGTWEGPHSSTGAIVDGDGATTFTAGSQLVLPSSAALDDFTDLAVTGGITVEATIQTGNTDALQRWVYWQQDDTDHFSVAMYVDIDGTVLFGWTHAGSGVSKKSDVVVNDGLPHHLAGRVSYTTASGAVTTIWVDGTAYSSTGVLNGAHTAKGVNIGGPLNASDELYSSFQGVLDEVAIYQTDLSTSRIQAHAAAVTAPWNGDRTGTRLGRIFDESGVTTHDFDTGVSVLGDAFLGGMSVAELARQLERTEQGWLYTAPDGTPTLLDRHQPILAARSTAVQWVFSDDPADTDALPCIPTVEPANARQVRNIVPVTWAGGSVTVEDAASRGQYGPRSYPISTVIDSAEEARNLGEWVTQHYAAPLTVVKEIELDPAADTRLWEVCLTAQPGDLVTVHYTPSDTGTAIEFDALITAVPSHDIGLGKGGVEYWRTRLPLSPAEVGYAPWILGTSELGTETKLAY